MNRILSAPWFPALCLAIVLASGFEGSHSAPDFNPTRVQTAGCAAGSLQCGVQQLDRGAIESIPLARPGARTVPANAMLDEPLPPVPDQGRTAAGASYALIHVAHSYAVSGNVQGEGSCDDGNERLFSAREFYERLSESPDAGLDLISAVRELRRIGARGCDGSEGLVTIRDARRVDVHDTVAIQSQLASGRPVVVDVALFENLYQLDDGVYERTGGRFLGAHAITLIGYDDDRSAFRFMNSWSEEWGDEGFGWISYSALRRLSSFAIVLLPHYPADGLSASQLASPLERVPERLVASRGAIPDVVRLVWSPVPGAHAYAVERKDPGQDTFQFIGFASEASFNDRFAQNGVAYRYRVRSIDEAGRSAPSASVEGASGSVSDSRLSGVVGLRARNHGQAGVILDWAALPGAQYYLVERFDNEARAWQRIGRVQQARYHDNRLLPDQEYTYRVVPANASGTGDRSDVVVFRSGGSSIRPADVSGLSATRGLRTDRVVVSWSSVRAAEAYEVYRFRPDRGIWDGPFSVTESLYVDRDPVVRSGWPLSYTVVARGRAGRSDPARTVSGYAARELAASNLEEPDEIRASIVDASVELTWSDVRGAQQYFIFRKRERDAEYSFVANTSAGVTRFNEPFPGQRGELYIYRVSPRASDAPVSALETISRAVAVFSNPERQMARTRFAFPQEPYEKFVGTWTALDWDGESGPQEIRITIEYDQDHFAGRYQVGDRPSRRFQSPHVMGSDAIETGGFKMELLPGAPGESIVDIDDARISPHQVHLAFVRDG